jgi:hypothetical protein
MTGMNLTQFFMVFFMEILQSDKGIGIFNPILAGEKGFYTSSAYLIHA